MGFHPYDEAAAICREQGASLPLPTNAEELESLETGFAGLMSGLVIDATDIDEDGVWEDSYGNDVTFSVPLYYYPSGQQSSYYSYRYMAVKKKDDDLLVYVARNRPDGQPTGVVFCQLPLDPPTPTVHVPPTPVKGETNTLT